MATITPFQPPLGSIFSFQATLDGQQYAISIPWNLAGQRWYVNCAQLNGDVVFLLPLIGSPTGAVIESLAWSLGTVTAVATLPHGLKIGTVVELAMFGCVPDAYNGTFPCRVIDEVTFAYTVASDPGVATVFGIANYDINIAKGYFKTSKLVFRESAQQFEVTP